MNGMPSLICCIPCFIYLCHVSYVYAIIYIFVPRFVCLCHDLYIYAMFYKFMSISIPFALIFIYAAPIFPFLLSCILSHMFYRHKRIHVVSTKIYVASMFVSKSNFSITPYIEKLSPPAVACGPTYPTGSEITRHNNEQCCTNPFSIVLHVAQL